MLKQHQLQHFGQKVFRCSACGKLLGSKKEMEAHIGQEHSGNDYCGNREYYDGGNKIRIRGGTIGNGRDESGSGGIACEINDNEMAIKDRPEQVDNNGNPSAMGGQFRGILRYVYRLIETKLPYSAQRLTLD